MQTQSIKRLPVKVIGLSVLFICGILILSFMVLATYMHYEHGGTSLALVRPQSLILSDVNVLSMTDETVREHHTVVVRDGVIASIQPADAPVPDDLPEIDGKGGFVMPGLIDLHVHVLDRSYAKSALAAGVTTLRNMGGYDYQLKWRDELTRGEWFGSRLILSSPIFNSVEQGDPLSHFRVNDPDIARRAVQDYIRKGYDFIKVYEGLHADVYLAVLDEAGKLGVPVAGHPSYDLMAANLEALGALASFEHVEEVFDGFLHQQRNSQKVIEAANFLHEHQVPLIPTLAVNQELTLLSQHKQAYLARQDLAAINPFARFVYEETSIKRWLGASPAMAEYNQQVDDYLNSLTLTLFDQGVMLGLGSDAGALLDVPGPATVREALLMIDAGIPVYDVLKSATVNAAAILQRSEQLGKIAPGFTADMLLLADNPLTQPQVLDRPQLVIQAGRVFTEEELRVLREEGHQHSGGLVSAVRHFLYLLFN